MRRADPETQSELGIRKRAEEGLLTFPSTGRPSRFWLVRFSLTALELVGASAGALKRGTVYVTLGRMQDKGYLASRLEDAPPAAGGLPRLIYTPTALGREALGAWVTAANRFRVRFAR